MKYKIKKEKEFTPIKINIVLESQRDLDEMICAISRTKDSFGGGLYDCLRTLKWS